MAIFTIGMKDFRSLVLSPMYMMIAGLCAIYWSFRYLRDVIQFAQDSMSGKLQGMEQTGNVHWDVFVEHIFQTHIILLLAIPAITMKLISEEKKLRSYDLLLTSPITATDITLGKFLAGFAAVNVLVGISFLYPLVTTFFMDLSFAPLFSAYVGLVLVVAVYVSIGLFASSLTTSNILSIILAFILCLTLLLMGQASEVTDNPLLSSVIQHMSLGDHFMSFIRGILQLKSIVFLVTCSVFFIFMSQRVVESSRWR